MNMEVELECKLEEKKIILALVLRMFYAKILFPCWSLTVQMDFLHFLD